MRAGIKVLRLHKVPILRQLHLEEAIMKHDLHNTWLILNSGAPPAVVMSMYARAESLVEVANVRRDNVKVIRRYSGGGTVFIDEDTVFASLIGGTSFLEPFNVPLFPREIMRWTEGLYGRALGEFSHEFALRENDYVFGEKKFGGTAQRIGKDRFVQHTSFLWDFDEHKMKTYLLNPEKQPVYRQYRSHDEFLCRLKDRLPSREDFQERVVAAMHWMAEQRREHRMRMQQQQGNSGHAQQRQEEEEDDHRVEEVDLPHAEEFLSKASLSVTSKEAFV